jgi:hypothetical protein
VKFYAHFTPWSILVCGIMSFCDSGRMFVMLIISCRIFSVKSLLSRASRIVRKEVFVFLGFTGVCSSQFSCICSYFTFFIFPLLVSRCKSELTVFIPLADFGVTFIYLAMALQFFCWTLASFSVS